MVLLYLQNRSEIEPNDESFDFHLDLNRVRTNAEMQLFSDVFSINVDEARQILKKDEDNAKHEFYNAKRNPSSFLRAQQGEDNRR